MTVDTLKELLKQCKADGKEILAEKPKKFYLTTHFETGKEIIDFMTLQHANNMVKMKEEYDRARVYSLDLSEVDRCGFNSPKQKPEQLKEWADKAYPTINVSLYENAFEQDYIISLMKNTRI